MYSAVRLIAFWISSRLGFMATCGMDSSTSTSKNGRSTNKKPPDELEPMRFFSAIIEFFVELRIERYMRRE